MEKTAPDRKSRTKIGFARRMELMNITADVLKNQSVKEITDTEWSMFVRMLNSGRTE